MTQKGDTLSLFVTVVEAHGKACRFWAQTDTESCQRIETLMEEAESELQSRPAISLDDVNVGDIFLAKFHEDNKWYRAKVKDTNKEDQKVTVFFIDYGNEEFIGVNEIAKGHGKYFEIPPQASQYLLGDIQAKNNHTWTETEVNGLQEQLVYGEFEGVVLNVGTVGNPPTLRLFSDEHQKETVVTTAIAAGFGTRASIGMETPLQQTILQAKQSYHVYVVYYESPLNFWIQLVDHEDVLNKLQDDIAAEVDDSSPGVQRVTLGTVCIGKFCDVESNFETFYRAVVTAVNPDNTCDVLYIDYGNSETVSLDKLKVLPPQYRQLSSQAVQCCLYGSLSNADDFQKMLESEHIYANVESVMNSGLHVVKLSEGPPISRANQPQPTKSPVLPQSPQNRLSNNNEVTHSNYKPLQFNVGKPVDLCISNVEPSGKFYCQLLENAPRLNHLMHSLHEQYSAGGTPVNIATPGTPCVTKSLLDPGVMYRSRILSHIPSIVQVHHIDFGITENVPPANIFFITEEFMDLPSQAVYCYLADAETFNPSEVANLLKRYESQTALVGRVMLKSGQQYEMELINTSGIQDVYIVHELQNNDVSKTSPNESYSRVSLQEGQWTDVQVTYVGDPANVYCQFVCSQEELGELMDKIEAHCSSGNAAKLTCFDKGTPCLAKYSEDDAWYRALVSDIDPSGRIDVHFVDYGNHDIVQKEKLRAIPDELMMLPKQCFRGVLDGLVNSGPWTEQETTMLFDMAAEESHPTVIIGYDAHDDLYMIQVFTSAEENINEKFATAAGKLSPKFRNRGPRNSQRTRERNLPNIRSPLGSTNGSLSSGPTSPVSGQGWAQWQQNTSPNEKLEIKPTEVHPGYEDILLETMVSPDEFYCRLLKNNDKLITFMETLNSELGCIGSEERVLQNPKQGMFCCAKFDGEWYRAKILSVAREGITVQYVDFGNTQTVPASDLKHLNPAHTKLPAQAVKCALAEIAPAQGTWTKESCDLLEKIMGDCAVVGAFTECRKDGTYLIDVIQAVKGGQVLARNVLINHRLAVNVGAQNHADQVILNDSRPRVSDINASSITVSSGKPIQKYNIQAVEVNQIVDVNVVHVETPTEFWVQLTQNCTNLEGLMDAIQHFYAALGPNQGRASACIPGMACIAQFSEDEMWYRGEVVRIIRGDEFIVRYVDYGNYEKRTLSDIWEIETEFLKMPAQAIQCSLYGVVPPPTGWTSTTKDTLEDLVLDKNLLAEIVAVSPSQFLTVKLIEIEGKMKTDIAEKLVQLKRAVTSVPPKASAPLMGSLRTTEYKSTQQQKVSTQNTLQPFKSDPKPMKKDLPPQDVALGDLMKINIVWANSPTSFFCQKAESQRSLQELMAALNGHYETLRIKDAEMNNPQPGQLCVALYNADGNWYRSRVIRTRNREAEVLYIDFGNKDRLPWSKLKVMKQEFMDVPAMAIHCSLKGMEVYCENFSADIEQYFLEIMNQDLDLKVLALPSAAGEPLTVSMRDKAQDDVANRIHQLEGKSAAPQNIKSPPRPQSSAVSMPSSIHNTPPRSQGAANMTPPQSLAANFTPPRSQQALDVNLKELNTPLRPGKTVNVTVSNIESVDHFFCQILENSEQLDAFMETLEAHYSAGKVASVLQGQLKCDMACAAQFSEDNFWYRAKVKRIVSQNEVEVIFVDYGNSEVTTLQKVCPLDQKFADYPTQAFECSLAGVSLTESLDATVYFRQLVEGKELKGQVKSQGRRIELDLSDPTNNINVNAEMASKYSSVATTTSLRQEYPMVKVPTEKDVEVYITHADSPQSFWLQLASQETEVQAFADSMLERYDSLGTGDEKLANCAVGAPCAARFSEDGAWYRGVIEEITGDAALVRFIDYGNTERVVQEDLKIVSSELLVVPPFALHCKLQGLSDPSNGWTEAHKVTLEGLEGNLTATFSQTSTAPFPVKLNIDGNDVAPQFGPVAQDVDVSVECDKYLDAIIPQSEVPVYASHVEDGFIYVQLAKDSDILQTVSDKLQDIYAGSDANDFPLDKIQTGNACAAKFSDDDSWYRACIENVSGEEIQVKFVDFGNGETTTEDSLKKLTQDLMEYPKFAYRCQLKDISCPSRGWPEGYVEALEDLLFDCEIMASFVGDQEPCSVTMKIDGEDFSQTVKTKFPALAGETLTQVDTQEIGTYPKQNVPTDVCAAFLSHVESPDCMYLQLASESDKLQEVTDKLQEVYESFGANEMTLASTSEGSVCCAKFSEDSAWYRAAIEECSGDEIKVRFVDFGNAEVTSSESLKQVTPELLQEPALAYRCCLDGLEPPAKGWSDGFTEKLEEMLIDQEIQTQFMNDTTPYIVGMKIDGDEVTKTLLAELANPMDTKDQAEVAVPEVKEDNVETNNAEKEKMVLDDAKHLTPLPSQRISEGDKVFVTSIDSPSLFYVHKQSQSDALDELMEAVSAACSESSPMSNPAVGQLCCAKFTEDESWYRAVVTEVVNDDITVLFCDYGKSDTVKPTGIVELPKSLSQQPAFAVACQLSGSNEGPWTENQIEQFRELATDKELVVTELIQCSSPESVRLLDGDLDVNITMGSLSCAESEDEFLDAGEEVENIQEEETLNRPVDDFQEASEGATEVEDIADVNAGTASEQSESEEFHDVKNEAESDKPEDQADDLKLPQPSTDDQSSEASEEFTDAVETGRDLVKLNPGEKVEVRLVQIKSPSRFWCRIEEAEQDCEATMATVEEYCSHSNVPENLNEGEIYGARYTNDEWCRVSIKAEEDEQVCAFFIDYGNTEKVYKSDLRSLPLSLQDEAVYALPCMLHGVKALKPVWSDEAKLRFAELCLDKKLLAEVMSTENDVSVIKLLDMGISVAEKLIEEGHAVESDCPTYEDSGAEDLQHLLKSDTESPEKSEWYTYRDLDQARSTLFFTEDDSPELQITKLPQTELKKGERAEIIISHVLRFDTIFIQLNRQQTELEEMITDMQETYESNEDFSEDFQSTIKTGLVCAARSAEDELWYRAHLFDVSERGDTVKVQFIDYGNTETLQVNQLQPLKPKFHTQRTECIKCKLHGAEDLTDDLFETFVSETQHKTLLAEVVDIEDGVPSLKMLDMGRCILSRLIPEGNRSVKDEDLYKEQTLLGQDHINQESDVLQGYYEDCDNGTGESQGTDEPEGKLFQGAEDNKIDYGKYSRLTKIEECPEDSETVTDDHERESTKDSESIADTAVDVIKEIDQEEKTVENNEVNKDSEDEVNSENTENLSEEQAKEKPAEPEVNSDDSQVEYHSLPEGHHKDNTKDVEAISAPCITDPCPLETPEHYNEGSTTPSVTLQGDDTEPKENQESVIEDEAALENISTLPDDSEEKAEFSTEPVEIGKEEITGGPSLNCVTEYESMDLVNRIEEVGDNNNKSRSTCASETMSEDSLTKDTSDAPLKNEEPSEETEIMDECKEIAKDEIEVELSAYSKDHESCQNRVFEDEDAMEKNSTVPSVSREKMESSSELVDVIKEETTRGAPLNSETGNELIDPENRSEDYDIQTSPTYGTMSEDSFVKDTSVAPLGSEELPGENKISETSDTIKDSLSHVSVEEDSCVINETAVGADFTTHIEKESGAFENKETIEDSENVWNEDNSGNDLQDIAKEESTELDDSGDKCDSFPEEGHKDETKDTEATAALTKTDQYTLETSQDIEDSQTVKILQDREVEDEYGDEEDRSGIDTNRVCDEDSRLTTADHDTCTGEVEEASGLDLITTEAQFRTASECREDFPVTEHKDEVSCKEVESCELDTDDVLRGGGDGTAEDAEHLQSTSEDNRVKDCGDYVKVEIDGAKIEWCKENADLPAGQDSDICFNYPCFSVGEQLDVTVSNTTSPSDFWCQLVNPSTTELPLLSDRIQYFCSTEPDSKITVTNPTCGMPCFARCSLDGNWYRGLVTNVNSGDVEVCYVDYGNSECTKVSNLRKLSSEFLELNAQAFKCRLSDVVSNDAAWDLASCARFEELVMDKDLNLTVCSKESGSMERMEELQVILHDNEDNIAEILVEGGYAHQQSRTSQEVNESYPPLDQGSVVNVSSCSCNSPDDFSLKNLDVDQEFSTLLGNLSTLLSRKEEISVGDEALVLSKRAVIKEVKQDQCLVTYVDEGSDQPVEASDVHTLPAEVSAIPPQVFKCKLAGIETESWTEEANTFFKDFLKCERLTAHVVSVEDKTHMVYLYDLDDPSGISINYQLVSHSFAWVLPNSELLNLDDCITEEFCAQQGELESSFLEFNQERRQSLGDLGSETDGVYQEEVEQEVMMFPSPVVAVGDTLQLTCLFAKDPDTLIGQLVASQADLKDLMESLKETCQKDDAESLDINHVHSGEACLAYSENRETWCRAKILAKEEDNLAVHFVDYGDGATVSSKHIKHIDQTAILLPAQAVTCSVAGIKPKEDEWSKDAVTVLSRDCVGNDVSATVSAIKEDGRLVASIHTTDGTDLAEMLVSQGFAEKMESIDSEKDN